MAIGVLGALGGRFDGPMSHTVGTVFSGGWSWACFAFPVGCFRRSKTEAALPSSSASAIGVAVHYLVKDLNPVAPAGADVAFQPSGGGVWSRIFIWGILAFLFGAPVGLIGNLAHPRHRRSCVPSARSADRLF
ncbi:hypothetical protein [Streptomyces sp. Wh19]|uniref:hypothetical protein n=1 Tax=Streptomyces sp. Wh19 TaxID=3076629 RepID=UPI002958C2A1|nr:hypothetical protein [Streptomyces sp. Wh19]MDV9199191.1 hypothetical protein [Streptomyces sp. Wh19]